MLRWNVVKTVEIHVEGRPVPWSVPRTFRYGGSKKNPKLIEWQAKVAEAARAVWGPHEAVTSPIGLTMVFGIETSDESLEGQLAVPWMELNELTDKHTKRGKPRADLTNLGKGTEDGIEGIIVVNDLLVVHKEEIPLWTTTPYAKIVVRILDGRKPVL